MLTEKDRKFCGKFGGEFGGEFGTSPFKWHLPGKPMLARLMT